LVNQLQMVQYAVNDLAQRPRPSLYWYQRDPVGFNPTQNQPEYGTIRQSAWGALLRWMRKQGFQLDSSVQPDRAAAYPYGNYFPSFPFRGIRDFTGRQAYGHRPSEQLYARLRGYRGILPINELPLINKPEPYEVPVYSQFGRA